VVDGDAVDAAVAGTARNKPTDALGESLAGALGEDGGGRRCPSDADIVCVSVSHTPMRFFAVCALSHLYYSPRIGARTRGTAGSLPRGTAARLPQGTAARLLRGMPVSPLTTLNAARETPRMGTADGR